MNAIGTQELIEHLFEGIEKSMRLKEVAERVRDEGGMYADYSVLNRWKRGERMPSGTALHVLLSLHVRAIAARAESNPQTAARELQKLLVDHLHFIDHDLKISIKPLDNNEKLHDLIADQLQLPDGYELTVSVQPHPREAEKPSK